MRLTIYRQGIGILVERFLTNNWFKDNSEIIIGVHVMWYVGPNGREELVMWMFQVGTMRKRRGKLPRSSKKISIQITKKPGAICYISEHNFGN